MRNKIYTKQEIQSVQDEWEERMNNMDVLALQMFANRLDFALQIAMRQGCSISSDPCSMSYSPIHAIVQKAREMAEKRNYK